MQQIGSGGRAVGPKALPFSGLPRHANIQHLSPPAPHAVSNVTTTTGEATGINLVYGEAIPEAAVSEFPVSIQAAC